MGNSHSNSLDTNTSSTDNERAHLTGKYNNNRRYRLPEVRARDRFEKIDPRDQINSSNAYEASIDKYDYLIVFPLTEGRFVHYKANTNEGDSPFISWLDIQNLWLAAVPGTDSTKLQSIEVLKSFWRKRTGSVPSNDDQIRTIAWLTIAREAIIDQLTSRSGLQLKLSTNNKHIFCRIRAPVKLLELHASSLNYRLQIKDEIDPGSEQFWNREIRGVPIELEEEKKQYTKDEANIILQNLYKAGKISPNDLNVDEVNEMPTTWTRRVHALERIADNVPTYNKYVTYLPFRIEKRLRYLYQTYPSIRGKTLFRSKDRIYLTKSIIDKYFDCNVLADSARNHQLPVITSIMALHDSNRGELITIDKLKKRWISFWRVNSFEVGSPSVTHLGYEEDESVPMYLHPFSQPLRDIRDYFGEKISLYFAWFGYYLYFLSIPAILGVIMEIIILYRGYVDTNDSFDIPTYTFILLLIIWSILYHNNWDVECKAVALKWGTKGYEEHESDRPQFLADPDEPTIRSVINNRKITNFPERKRFFRSAFAYFIVLACIIVDLVIASSLIGLEFFLLADYSEYTWLTWSPSIFQALLIKLGTYLYIPTARWLTNTENHRTETEYEDHLVIKIVIFEIFNSYYSLGFTAFAKGSIFSGCSASCMYDLRQLLISIIIVRVFLNILDLFLPSLKNIYKEYFDSRITTSSTGLADSGSAATDNISLLQQQGNDEHDENNDYILEIDREKYRGVFDEYSYAVFQYGYLMLFSSALPLMPVIALFENLIKLRTDAWKLCTYSQRPDVQLAEDPGVWSELMEYMSSLGIVCNTAILVFTSRGLNDYTELQKGVIFLLVEQIVLIIRILMRHLVLNTNPGWLRDISARQEYIENKYLHGIEDDKNDNEMQTYMKGHLEDTIDFDALNLYDLRKGVATTEAEYKRIEELENERRKYSNELKYFKEKLFEVYKIETFNETTGIGETKHGLPLGRLNVQILEIQNLHIQNLSSSAASKVSNEVPVKVRVQIHATRSGITNAGPPLSALSDTKVRNLNADGHVVINESLGPFAPIRTQDADVFFEVLNIVKDSQSVLIASASIKLRELQDQLNHDHVLHLSIHNTGNQSNDSKNTASSLTKSTLSLNTNDPKLLVSLKFEYSKVLPLRNKIYSIQEKLRLVEKKLAELKSGRNMEEFV